MNLVRLFRVPLMLPFLTLLVSIVSACTINIHYPITQLPFHPKVYSKPVATHAKHNNRVTDMLSMYTSNDGVRQSELRLGEPFELNVSLAVNAFLYCYYRQANGDIIQLYPNRHSVPRIIPINQIVTIPDNPYFKLISSRGERAEAIMCLASEENLIKKLPQRLYSPGFEPIPVPDFDALYMIYRETTDRALMARVIEVLVRSDS